MKIRTAEAGDAEAVSGMYEDFFAYNAANQPAYYRPAAERGSYPEQVLRSEASVLFLAEENGAAVGFLHAEDAFLLYQKEGFAPVSRTMRRPLFLLAPLRRIE